MHSTERTTYAQARIYTYLQGLTLTGTPTVLIQDQVRRASIAAPWIRAIATIGESSRYDGYHSATMLAYRVSVVLLMDLFWPLEGGASVNLYDVDVVADELADAFRHRSLSFREYSTPASPTEVTGSPIRFLGPPIKRTLPSGDGYARRQIVAEGFYHLRHAA